MALLTSLNLDGYQGDVNVTGALTMSSTGSFGSAGTAGNVTTLGADNLVLNTNNGTNSGNITLTQGVNGNITLTTNGTGVVQVSGSEVIQGGVLAWNTTTPGLTAGSLHLGAASATTNAGSAITFGARDSSSGTTAQAGIYINSDGGFGTRMYFATSSSYATGSVTGMSLDEAGRVRILRNIPSTNTTSGSLIVTGGVGISGNTFIGGTGSVASQGLTIDSITRKDYVDTTAIAMAVTFGY